MDQRGTEVSCVHIQTLMRVHCVAWCVCRWLSRPTQTSFCDGSASLHYVPRVHASPRETTMSISSTVAVPFHGGCACGSVRYECLEPPLGMFNCHCRDCQRASGGAFVTVAVIRESALTITGEPKYFRSVGDSGRWTDRGFCSDCGTPMFAKGQVAPGYMTIKPGSLDDASWFRPSADAWAPRAPAWLHLDPNLPKSDKGANILRK